MGCGGRARGPGLTSDLTEDEGRVGSLLRTSVPRSSGPSGYDGHLALGGSVWPGRSCRQAVLTGRTGGGVPRRGLGAGRALLVWVPASGGDPARLTQLETRHCERQTGPPPPTRPSPAAGPRAPTRPAAGGACHRPSQRAREAPPPHSRRPSPRAEGSPRGPAAHCAAGRRGARGGVDGWRHLPAACGRRRGQNGGWNWTQCHVLGTRRAGDHRKATASQRQPVWTVGLRRATVRQPSVGPLHGQT